MAEAANRVTRAERELREAKAGLRIVSANASKMFPDLVITTKQLLEETE